MQERIKAALATLPAPLSAALAPYVSPAGFAGWLRAEDVFAICSKTGLDVQALSLALLPVAAAYSVAPISKFYVGAICRGVSGNLYFGANMEFAEVSLQQTVHAEQSAIAHAWLRGEQALTDITINYSPCGHCRQFMNELNTAQELQIHLPERAPSKLHDYLPDAFGPRDLSITTLLMDVQDHGMQAHSTDPLVNAALDAANHSHAPYSQSYAGVALQMQSGAIYSGMYAENAAFNPSIPPLQAALINLNMSGESAKNIVRAVLVESQTAILSQQDATETTLHALGVTEISCLRV
ncbi:MAG: cytidine deaminase [Vibrionaceae bacterium]